jgi:hypothetical protein
MAAGSLVLVVGVVVLVLVGLGRSAPAYSSPWGPSSPGAPGAGAGWRGSEGPSRNPASPTCSVT